MPFYGHFRVSGRRPGVHAWYYANSYSVPSSRSVRPLPIPQRRVNIGAGGGGKRRLVSFSLDLLSIKENRMSCSAVIASLSLSICCPFGAICEMDVV